MSPPNKELILDLAIDEDEEELRRIAPARAAFGKDASDYRNMYDIFASVVQHAKAMAADPNAFVSSKGEYNVDVINAWKGLMATATKALSELSKMRNADKMTQLILDQNTRDMIGESSVLIGLELKKVIEEIDNGGSSDEVVFLIKRLMYKRLPEIFVNAASDSLEETKSKFGLS